MCGFRTGTVAQLQILVSEYKYKYIYMYMYLLNCIYLTLLSTTSNVCGCSYTIKLAELHFEVHYATQETLCETNTHLWD